MQNVSIVPEDFNYIGNENMNENNCEIKQKRGWDVLVFTFYMYMLFIGI
jgi:hypothetical protein